MIGSAEEEEEEEEKRKDNARPISRAVAVVEDGVVAVPVPVQLVAVHFDVFDAAVEAFVVGRR